MKHLKKILLAVLILALLSTAVVVIALADSSVEAEVVYTGKVEEARELLDAVSQKTTNEEKSAQLKAVYKYVFRDNPVDPYEPGFDQLMLDYSDATVAVAQGFIVDYMLASDFATKEAKLTSAYSHYTGAPIYTEYERFNADGYEAWQNFRVEYTTRAVEVLSTYLEPIRNAATLDERHQALKVLNNKFSTRGIYFALPNDEDATYEIPGLTDFVHEFNNWCMSVASDYIDTVTTPEEMTAVRAKFISSNNAYNRDPRFFNHVYLPLVEKMDLNIIKYANQLLDKVELTADNYRSQAPAALQAVYTYLEKTPCVALTRTQLANTVGASHEELQIRVNRISYEIAQYYYAEVEKLVGGEDSLYSEAVADFINFLKSCPAIIYRPVVNSGVYSGDLSVAEDLLLAVKDAEAGYLESFAALYEYLAENAPDPNLEGARKFYDEYEALKREVSDFIAYSLEDLNPAPTVIGGNEIDEEAFRCELEKLAEFAAYLNSTPVSSSAITKYNETALVFLETVEKLWCRQLEFETPEIGDAAGDIDEALSLLEAVDLTAEDALEAYAELYEYLVNTPVDRSVEGAEELYEDFAALTAEVARMISKEIGSLATNPEYLAIFNFDCPEIFYRDPVVESFDGTVEEANELLDEAHNLVLSSDDLAEILKAYGKIYVYNYKTAVSSNLVGSGAYYQNFECLTKDVSKLITETLEALESYPVTEDYEGEIVLDVDALKENASTLAVIAELLKECPISSELISVYNAKRAEFYASISSSYGSEHNSERFENDLATLNEIAVYLENAPISSELYDLYNAKASAFKVGLQILKCPATDGKIFESQNLNGSLTEAVALLDAVKAASQERLTAYSELHNYVKANAISPEEEGYSEFYAEYSRLTSSILEDIFNKLENLNSSPLYFEAEFPAILYSAIEPLTYAGNLAEATKLLNNVKYALGDVNPDVDEIMETYAELSDYVRRNAVPRDVAGADDFYREFESVSDAVSEYVLGEFTPPSTLFKAEIKFGNTGSTEDANTIYNEIILNAENTLLEEYAALYSYMKAYGVNPGAVNLAEANLASEVFAKFKALSEEVHKIISARIAAASAITVKETKEEALASIYNYLKVTHVSQATVTEYNAALVEHKTSYPTTALKSISVTVSFASNGDAAYAEALYNSVVDATKSVVLSEYVKIYDYMVKSGVNLAASKAADAAAAKAIFTKFVTLTEAVNEIISTELDGILKLDENEMYNALMERRAYLEVTPVSYATVNKYNEVAVAYELSVNEEVLEFVRDTRVSDEAIKAYNEIIAYLKSYVDDSLAPDAEAMRDSLEEILGIAEFLKASPLSLELVTAYNSTLHNYTKALKRAIDARYGEFISVKDEFTDYLASSAATLEKLGFTVLPDDVDYEAFEEKIAELDGYVNIKAITDLIYSTDIDATGEKVSTVDEFREAFVKALNDIIAADLLVYVPMPESDIYSGVVVEAQDIIDRYNSTVDVELKAEIYKELFDYTKNNAMNPKLHGYEEIMESFDAIGEEVYRSFIAKIDAAEDKSAAMSEMRAYLEETPISEAAFNAYNMKYLYTYSDQLNETYEDFAAVTLKLHEFIESFEGAEELIESFEGFSSAIDNYETLETLALVQFYEMKTLDEDPNSTTVSVTARGGAVKVLNNYVRKYPINSDSYAYDETMADVSRITDAYKQLVEDARAALDDKTPLEDYNNDVYMSIVNFDNGQNPLGFTHSDNSTGANTGSRYDVLPDEARGGMYLKLTYGYQSDINPKTGATITPRQQFIGKSGLPGTIPFVFEFDLTGDNGVEAFPVNRLDRSGSITQMEMFAIRNNKFHIAIDGKEQPAWKDGREVITPGEWTNFIFVYDPVNVTLTAYIDYEFVGTWSVKTDDPTDKLVEIRINAVGSGTGASVNIDNYNFYSGSNFRIRDKFESMNAGDEFEYFVNYMTDETRQPTSRLQAYQKATSLLEEIKLDSALLESLADVIAKYEATDAETDIIAPAKAVNLIKIKEYGSLLAAYEGHVNTQNYATVQLLVDELESFIANNSEYIDKSNDAYKEVSSSVSRFKSLLDRCNNVTSFVNALKKFSEAYTLTAKTKYYTSVVQYYELAQLYRDDIRLEVMSDPAILEFEAMLNDGLTPSDEGYVDIFTYYEVCGEALNIQQNKENSKRIIDCIEFVTSLEGYEDTIVFWQANFDYINKYMTIIRDIVNVNAYDASVEGVDEAIAKFRTIDVYFYEVLQNVHIEFISEQLDKYASSASYIDKLGICTYVSNYIEANDVDEKNETLASLILKNETYLKELDIYREDYQTVLEQNTVKFVNTVEEMKTQVSYKALSELYEKALGYYYEMNITPASEAAIIVFEGYAEALKKMEEDSALFIGYANAIAKARDDAALFTALVNCKAYRDLASLDVDGVLKAVEKYEEALAEYNATAEIINGDIAETNSVVTVTRTNNIGNAIMSVIDKVFNR